MWYECVVELGDWEVFNGLGILYCDGFGVFVDLVRV